jgi:3-hydroxyisobutyrate dehydrogenase-like beta-hydroxyacid dehydrogenase
MQRVGFVGVGFMGKGIVKSIVRSKAKSYKGALTKYLSIYDVSGANIEKLFAGITTEEQGHINVCHSPAEVARNSDVVGLSLPTEAATDSVIFGDNGLLNGFDFKKTESPIILDHGTFTRKFVLQSASRAKEKSVKYLDAPVHGGPVGAENGRPCCYNSNSN